VSAVAGAAWVRWVFAAIYAALALFYVVRFLAAGRVTSARPTATNRSVDVSRCVMSLGMVAMLVPWIDPLPRLGWQLLFSAAAGHIALRLIRRRVRPAPVPAPEEGGHHELHLMIGGLAMVYTLAAPSAGPGMAGMGSTGPVLPVLAWVFIAYFLVFVVYWGARLAVSGDTLAPRGVVTSPHLLGSSEIVMAIGMSYMLMTML
jgi:Domain of unknown function (DUF5134)